MRCLYNEMRWGASLGDRRFRSPGTIANASGYTLKHVRGELRRMELAGEVETRKGYGRAHGNSKVYRLRRAS